MSRSSANFVQINGRYLNGAVSLRARAILLWRRLAEKYSK